MDEHEAGDASLAHGYDLERGVDLARDVGLDLAPYRELPGVLVSKPRGDVAYVLRLNEGEERVRFGDVLENLVEDGLGHHLLWDGVLIVARYVGEGLLGVAGLKRLDDGLVVLVLLGGELPEAALCKDGAVVGCDCLSVLLQDGVVDGGLHLHEALLHRLRVVAHERLGEVCRREARRTVEVDCHVCGLQSTRLLTSRKSWTGAGAPRLG